LADLTKGKLKAPREKIVEALRGRIRDHHRFMLQLHLEQIGSLEKAVEDVERRLAIGSNPFARESNS
jgi:hypothetical protein